MKKLLSLVLALSFCAVLCAASAPSPKTISFDSPVSVAKYAQGASTAVSILPLDYVFATGQLRFQLLDASGAPVANGAVFGVIVTDGSDATIKTAVLAAIAAAK
jgi:hypothetical protein